MRRRLQATLTTHTSNHYLYNHSLSLGLREKLCDSTSNIPKQSDCWQALLDGEQTGLSPRHELGQSRT